MGLFNLSVVLPQIVASNLGHFIEGYADKSVIFMISAGTLAISAVLWLLVKEQRRNSESIYKRNWDQWTKNGWKRF